MQKIQKILVVGASGGTGWETVQRLVRTGHQVTALARSADKLAARLPGVMPFPGDATDPDRIDEAVRGQDIVIVTLGISENPLRVRLIGAKRTPNNVRSLGTRNVIAAMKKHGVRRLVVLSSYGVGQTRALLRFVDRLFFRLILKPQIDDTELQEVEVRQSGVDWVLAQPVHLTDAEDDAPPFTSVRGEIRENKVARKSVARFLAAAALKPSYVGQSVAISG